MAETTNTDITLEKTAEENKSVVTPENEMEANVSMDQLSYICEYCGKINAITSPNCARCGKRRPRSEYLNAMNRLKNAQSLKSQYIDEQARLAAEREDAEQKRLARLVEDRVADEKAQILAQQAVKLEQETDEIKRNTARDAVLRIIAAERAADEKVRNADLRAEEAIKGRDRETAEQIAAEREKVLYAAAKRLVSERAGIENAAEERIIAERNNINQKAQETIDATTEAVEKDAARRAALKVIAAEQASVDRSNIEREAIQRAALDRVAEERRMAEVNAYSKFSIEKEAIQRAVDERIKAEREALYGKRNSYGVAGGNGAAGTVQPFAIVPYVNSQQPLYQYNNVKMIYRFVPDAPAEPEQQGTKKMQTAIIPQKKSIAVRILSLFVLIFSALILVAFLLDITQVRVIADLKNLDIALGLFGKGSTVAANALKDTTMFITPIGSIALLAGAVLCVITGLIGIITNKAGVIFPIFAAIAFAGAAMIPVGLIIGKTAIADVFTLGLIIILAIAAVVLILASIAAAIYAKNKKRAKALEIK